MTTHGLIGAARLGSARHSEALVTPHPSTHFISPAMGPDDELSPFARTLRSGVGTVGAPSEPPVRYVSSPYLNSLGNGMGDWRSSTAHIDSRSSAPPPSPQEPGGLYGLMRDHLRDY